MNRERFAENEWRAGVNARHILNAQPCCKRPHRRHDDLVPLRQLIFRASLGLLALVSFAGALILSAAH